MTCRSSHRRCSIKKEFLTMLQNFAGRQALAKKKETCTGKNSANLLRTLFLQNTPRRLLFEFILRLYMVINPSQTNVPPLVFWCFQSVYRSSRSLMFFKIDVLKNIANFTGNYLWWNLFLIKMQAWRFTALLKRDSNAGVFQ